jgi:hypothetical protein
MPDRYVKVVLTAIAVELLWLAASTARPASAQQPSAMSVVITGIRLDPHADALPVTVEGTVLITPDGPLKIEADRPLPVESVPYTPGARPGG